ncbi:TetR family transcriptional regulator [Streptomyces sp. NPDC097619]|uniref:TetR/AcrR family transcriptional regulator n=1 Tax=Streptomyces sp. NPDC097619 TaxID=3157228 RepID=UPI00333381AE
MSTPGPASSTPRPAAPPTADRRTLIADTAIALVAATGLRGLTHRAVDSAAGLSPGSTSYYFRTRTALIGACYDRLAALDLEEAGIGLPGTAGATGADTAPDTSSDASADAGSDARSGAGGDRATGAAPTPESAARLLGGLLYRWSTTGRARQLARYELSLEAARTPELEPALHRAGLAARDTATALLAALGAPRPRESAELLVAWTDGLLYDRLAGATARSRPAPDPAELTAVARLMLDAVLDAPPPGGGPTTG